MFCFVLLDYGVGEGTDSHPSSEVNTLLYLCTTHLSFMWSGIIQSNTAVLGCTLNTDKEGNGVELFVEGRGGEDGWVDERVGCGVNEEEK